MPEHVHINHRNNPRGFQLESVSLAACAGPRRSVVTIGVFTTRDIDQNTNRPRNPEIARIRKDYPLNLLNGQYPIVVGRTAAGTPAHQVSEVMRMP